LDFKKRKEIVVLELEVDAKKRREKKLFAPLNYQNAQLH